jgi:hypothetical protein
MIGYHGCAGKNLAHFCPAKSDVPAFPAVPAL